MLPVEIPGFGKNTRVKLTPEKNDEVHTTIELETEGRLSGGASISFKFGSSSSRPV